MHHLDNSWVDENGLIKYEQWERRVFEASTHYSVVVTHGRGEITTKWYRTYPEAMLVSLHTPRSLLYAATESGRAVCIVRKQFGEYLALYNELTGQRLRMPPDPLVKRAMRERKSIKRRTRK